LRALAIPPIPMCSGSSTPGEPRSSVAIESFALGLRIAPFIGRRACTVLL
jgi:hypothetical protein